MAEIYEHAAAQAIFESRKVSAVNSDVEDFEDYMQIAIRSDLPPAKTNKYLPQKAIQRLELETQSIIKVENFDELVRLFKKIDQNPWQDFRKFNGEAISPEYPEIKIQSSQKDFENLHITLDISDLNAQEYSTLFVVRLAVERTIDENIQIRFLDSFFDDDFTKFSIIFIKHKTIKNNHRTNHKKYKIATI